MISKDKSTILLYFWWLTEENGLKDVQSEANYTAPDSIVPNKFAFLRTLTSNWSSHHTTYWQHGDHLGSASWVTDTNGVGYQHLQYMPWGEQWVDQRKTGYSYNTRYTFSGKERDEETGFSYFGARYYQPSLSIWLSVDPMAAKYPSLSPYVYCGDNPVVLKDPNGREISPIYDLSGNFLGTDDQGLQGQLIMMKKEHFVQGMQHNNAVYQSAIDRAENPVSEAALFGAKVHQANLYKRPDWDGFVTRKEGISWAKSHVNALKHPTPENTLYLDASKMDFGTLSIGDFKNGVGQVSPVNLLTYPNSVAATGNDILFNTIYALGHVNMLLLDANGHVQIINDNATDYDWNTGGSVYRDRLIKAERFLKGLNDSHGFKVYYYGQGKLN